MSIMTFLRTTFNIQSNTPTTTHSLHRRKRGGLRLTMPYFKKRITRHFSILETIALDLWQKCRVQNPEVFAKNVGQKLQFNIINGLLICFLAAHSLHASINDQFTIMIDPAGDAKHTGRLIQDTLERGISLQCAEQLKATLTQKFKNIRVILTRVPGETIQPLQNASFANRLGVDLYVSLYFYHEQETPAYVTLYHYLENPVTDLWHKPINLSLYQVNQAHLLNLKTTQAWGNIILEVLQDKRCSKFFRPRGIFGIPFTPLVGIKAPAIAVEVGLKNKQDWQHIIDPLVIAIERIMQ